MTVTEPPLASPLPCHSELSGQCKMRAGIASGPNLWCPQHCGEGPCPPHGTGGLCIRILPLLGPRLPAFLAALPVGLVMLNDVEKPPALSCCGPSGSHSLAFPPPLSHWGTSCSTSKAQLGLNCHPDMGSTLCACTSSRVLLCPGPWARLL